VVAIDAALYEEVTQAQGEVLVEEKPQETSRTAGGTWSVR
jgi:hypothetical protein